MDDNHESSSYAINVSNEQCGGTNGGTARTKSQEAPENMNKSAIKSRPQAGQPKVEWTEQEGRIDANVKGIRSSPPDQEEPYLLALLRLKALQRGSVFQRVFQLKNKITKIVKNQQPTQLVQITPAHQIEKRRPLTSFFVPEIQ